MAESITFVKGRRESDALRAEMNTAGMNFDPHKLSKLYFHCFVGSISDVEQGLQESGLDLNHKETNMQFTSLHCVTSGSQRVQPNPNSDHVAVAKLLIQKGANPNAQDVYGYTGLMHITSRHSRLDVAQALLELGADPNIRNRFGCVALHESVMASNLEACTLLCKFGADPSIKDVDGVTPYDCARAFPHINMVLLNAEKKLKGEQVVEPGDKKKCGQCQKAGSMRCSQCQTIYYCSKDCQKLHWKEHKKTCKKPDDYVTVDISSAPPNAKFMSTISTQAIYGKVLDNKELNPSKIVETDKVASAKKQGKLFIAKIQVPMGTNSKDPLMIYDKSKNFQTLITTGNCTKYDDIVHAVKTKGIMGVKAYFNAAIHDTELRIHVNEVLPQQPW